MSNVLYVAPDSGWPATDYQLRALRHRNRVAPRYRVVPVSLKPLPSGDRWF